jgi:small-conductance mechanosensitive channel/CRP-like cAMP-binding protein
VDPNVAGPSRSLELFGVLAALVLLFLARWLLPPADKRRTGLPAVYLGIAVLCGGLNYALSDQTPEFKVLDFLDTFFLLASLGRSLVLLAIDVAFGRRTHRAPPRIFRDLTQALVYVVILMLTLRAIGVEPSSLLTTSALLTAVVGLALQDTLGNMVSGLALQMQRPFEVGDWIQFENDPRQIGQVTEVNWRAITVVTSDLVEVIVPNGLLAKAPIRNYSKPSPVMRRVVTVQGPYGVPPGRVHEAILSGLVGTPGVLDDPAPWIQTRSFADSGVEYGVFFFTRDFGNRDRVDGHVRDRVWYALQRASVNIPFPIRTVHMHTVSEETEQRERDRELERRDRALKCVDFLDVLSPESHRALASAAQLRLYAAGEVVFRQGEPSNDFYIIDRGEAQVELGRDGTASVVALLGAGRFFGEMGVMTGEARAATVRARTECQLLVIDKAAVQRALESAPGVVEKISDLLARRQAELEAVNASRGPRGAPIQERSKRLFTQIKEFFKI